MRKAFVFLFPLALALAACADDARSPVAPDPAGPRPAAGPLALAAGSDYVPQRILVKFRPHAPIAELLAANGATFEGPLALDISKLQVPLGFEKMVAGFLAASPWVEFAEPDYLRTAGIPCELGS
ncbi:MAG TPA: hypothetical protein VM778_08885, partial [Gemmatimonadota bacterium]|nr:hypothetical protein [Gemmatimonadota bacterium]